VLLVRSRAAEWGVDPDRVGFVGFSAGAILAADLAIGDRASRPDFVGLIYGVLRTPAPGDAPPAFIAAATDDEMLPNDALLLYNGWKAAGRPVELHIYERGGHGFGMTTKRATSDRWFDEFLWWMQSRGVMRAVAHDTPR
jgi:acetyl esterase/lipase